MRGPGSPSADGCELPGPTRDRRWPWRSSRSLRGRVPPTLPACPRNAEHGLGQGGRAGSGAGRRRGRPSLCPAGHGACGEGRCGRCGPGAWQASLRPEDVAAPLRPPTSRPEARVPCALAGTLSARLQKRVPAPRACAASSAAAPAVRRPGAPPAARGRLPVPLTRTFLWKTLRVRLLRPSSQPWGSTAKPSAPHSLTYSVVVSVVTHRVSEGCYEAEMSSVCSEERFCWKWGGESHRHLMGLGSWFHLFVRNDLHSCAKDGEA